MCEHTPTPSKLHCTQCFAPLVPISELSETDIQADAVLIARAMFPEWVMFHNNNNQVSKAAGVKARKAGVLAGIPDVSIFHPGGMQLVEMKTRKGTVSPDQKEIFKKLSNMGQSVLIARSVLQFVDICKKLREQHPISH